MNGVPIPIGFMIVVVMIIIGMTLMRASGMFDAKGKSSAACSRCKTSNPSYAKFCRRCGQAISSRSK